MIQVDEGQITTVRLITKLTFRALYLRQSKYTEIGPCVVVWGSGGCAEGLCHWWKNSSRVTLMIPVNMLCLEQFSNDC